MPWSTPFDDPVPLPAGGALVTLEEAARYIQKLPKKEQQLAHWQTATGILIGAAEEQTRGGFYAGTRPMNVTLYGRYFE